MRVCGPNDANGSNIIALCFGDHEAKETVLGVASPRPLGFVCHAFILGEMTAWQTNPKGHLRRGGYVGSCWLKSFTGFKICAATCNTGVQKWIQHVTCVTSNNVGTELLANKVASVCTGLKITKPLCRRSSEDETLFV